MTHRIVLFLLLLLTGCATTFAETRQADPLRTSTFPSPAAQLASCTLLRVQQADTWLAYHLIEDHSTPRWLLHGTRPSNFLTLMPAVYGEVSFLPVDPSSSLVELRTASSGGSYFATTIWPLIETCAKTPS